MTSLLELDTRQEEETKEPAKAWRNWYRARRDGALWNGSPRKRGEHVYGACVWPSAEIAEAWALAGKDKPDRFGRMWRSTHFKYLGAYPEGEKPDV